LSRHYEQVKSKRLALHCTKLIKEEKIFYCPLKKNRLVGDSFGEAPYRTIETLAWAENELQQGKVVKVKKFAQARHLKMFRVTVPTNRTDYIMTNNGTQSDTDETQKVSAQPWKTSAVSPRGKTNHRHREMSVSIEPFATQSHCVCTAGMVSFQRTG